MFPWPDEEKDNIFEFLGFGMQIEDGQKMEFTAMMEEKFKWKEKHFPIPKKTI